MSYDPDALPAAEEIPERRPRSWLRWLGVGVAAAVLLFGIASLVASLARRANEERTAALDEMKKIIASEEAELEDLQSDYDETLAVLQKKQDEYDEVRRKLESGVVESAADGQQSLAQLRADAENTQKNYSAALAAYDAAVDAAEQSTAGYDEAKTQLEALKPFLDYAAAYEQFTSGETDKLPDSAPAEGEDAPDAQTWYTAVVLPAAELAGLTLPDTVEALPEAIREQAAGPAANVKAYEDALAAVKEAEAKLAEANAAQETAAKAYADSKAAEKTSEDWLNDCEQEIDRLEKRVKDLERSIDELNTTLADHHAELKKLESK